MMNTPRTITPGMVCEFPDCDRPATDLAWSRRKAEVLACCDPHAYMVVDEDNPEYDSYCPNCGCGIPVN